MKITRRQVLYQKADQIDCEAHRGNPVILHQKKPSRWRAGIIDQYRRHEIVATEAVRECNRIDSKLKSMEG